MVRLRSRQRGDTLTEVMFATAVAALAIVLTMMVMNRSLAQTQMAVENTLVRQSISAEAEMLRYARDQYTSNPTGAGGSTWRTIIGLAKGNTDSASSFGTCYETSSQAPPDAFYLQLDDSNVPNLVRLSSVQEDDFQPDPFATVGRGIWVEPVEGGSATRSLKYIDLHIRACWEPPATGPNATLGTIVRLYYDAGEAN